MEFARDKITSEPNERIPKEEILSGVKQDFPILEFVNENVTSVNKIDFLFEIITDSQSYSAKAIIISTGIPELKGMIKGEKDFLHKGVSHCAVCDGALFRGRKSCIIGNGNIAARGALFLRKFCL